MPFMPNPHEWHFYLHKLTTLSLLLYPWSLFWVIQKSISQNKKMQILLSKFAQLRNNYYLCSRKGCL